MIRIIRKWQDKTREDETSKRREKESMKKNPFIHSHSKPKHTRTPAVTLATQRPIERSIDRSIERTNERTNNLQRWESGATGCCLVLHSDAVIAANVGDTRAVLCRSGKAMPLTRDHTPSVEGEKARIEKAGGYVKDNRVCGELRCVRCRCRSLSETETGSWRENGSVADAEEGMKR